jgi:hypothetical protein
MGDWSADRLSTPNFRKRLPKPQTKPADLQRMQAGWTLVWRGLAPRIKGYSGMPNYALNFDGGLKQNFANQGTSFTSRAPLFLPS